MSSSDSFRAFVLMPFAPDFDDIYRFGIKDTAKEVGISAERVDEQMYSEGILERIYSQIRAADIIIADMSGQNANVFYEVGYAHGLNKLCVLVTQSAKDIPFDLKHQRHIVYGNSIARLKADLKTNLDWAKMEVLARRKSGIRLQPKITAKLEKVAFVEGAKPLVANVTVQFQIDLFNETDVSSPELEAIYFYSGKRWEVRQNSQACSSIAADVPGYAYRYFLETPMRRLPKLSWAQLNFEAKLQWATAFGENEMLLDSYDVAGRALLRLVTSAGSFDHEVSIQATAEEELAF